MRAPVIWPAWFFSIKKKVQIGVLFIYFFKSEGKCKILKKGSVSGGVETAFWGEKIWLRWQRPHFSFLLGNGCSLLHITNPALGFRWGSRDICMLWGVAFYRLHTNDNGLTPGPVPQGSSKSISFVRTAPSPSLRPPFPQVLGCPVPKSLTWCCPFLLKFAVMPEWQFSLLKGFHKCCPKFNLSLSIKFVLKKLL